MQLKNKWFLIFKQGGIWRSEQKVSKRENACDSQRRESKCGAELFRAQTDLDLQPISANHLLCDPGKITQPFWASSKLLMFISQSRGED